MAQKVEWYNREAEGYVESRKEYEVYTFNAIRKGASSWDRDSGVNLTLYVDEETGAVTTNVRLYEEGLK